jgi:biopolymer transport protein ExbD
MNSAHLLGSTVVLASLMMASNILTSEYGHSGGIPVLLSHQCTHQEDIERGDGREIFVRYRLDHSSFVNEAFMPNENDLRREIAKVMATRQEQGLYLAADDGLTYRDVSDVFSALQKDDPELKIILLTKSQVGEVENIRWYQVREICVSFPNS